MREFLWRLREVISLYWSFFISFNHLCYHILYKSQLLSIQAYPQSGVRVVHKNAFTRLIAQTHDGEVGGHEDGHLAPKACVSRENPF